MYFPKHFPVEILDTILIKQSITVVALFCHRRLVLFKYYSCDEPVQEFCLFSSTSTFCYQSKIISVLFVRRTEKNTCMCIDALDYHYSTHVVWCSSSIENLTFCLIFTDMLLEYWPLQVVHLSSLDCWWPWITSVAFEK